MLSIENKSKNANTKLKYLKIILTISRGNNIITHIGKNKIAKRGKLIEIWGRKARSLR